ncbi:Malate/lactate/ureidoglycolate dehydrogenase, LDH2 family [Mesobacillus persicus]|uniref:Malate/lactate/ureidoglycolate dehydrogenase, LDH2 family n=1 Tax=Mesobacillus persicus TaxID=930146 RepID=A0A1H8D9Y4_9BACI|nr:Ldh family oxidoreductase [Mesobacillus persicus]SEN03297.1 Malate/lactate/ureidoglycolate dehydrogenase, LDH2 family [Mesobacillus persicus]
MHISIEQIRQFSNQCFTKLDMPQEEAEIITEVLLEADLREIHSHGFLRLPIYIERIQKGLITNKADIHIEKENAATVVMDGNFGAGQVVAYKAMEKSIEKAVENGIGLVAVKNSNHFGITAYYSLMAAKQDKIGIVISNVAPLMPAIGGAEKVIGNNPISIAAPAAEGNSIVLDMALSNTAYGKILFAKEKNQQIPEGWGIDAKGLPTKNPDHVINGGFLSPVGGPKGFGLAVMGEILTGVLTGGHFSKMIPSMYDLNQKQSISHFLLTIDIKQLIPLEVYYSSMKQLISYIKDSKKAEGTEHIYLPGEIEFLKEARNREVGVPMQGETFKKLNEIARELNINALTL